ncbi:MAG: histidine phosphatase family protein [Wenzhouxiangella sp.]|jgi:phosphohistidine phosphatase|nr:histidine phosphatase family protein [Wenzhouxiangella sp.]
MKLWVLRHARAEPESTSGRDRDRRLSPAGRRCCRHLNEVISASEGWPPERILVSPAVRTRETAALALQGLEVPAPEIDASLWMADVSTLIDRIQSSKVSRLMVIGHNPGLESLVMMLGGSLPVPGLKPGTLVLLEFKGPIGAGPAETLQLIEPNEST